MAIQRPCNQDDTVHPSPPPPPPVAHTNDNPGDNDNPNATTSPPSSDAQECTLVGALIHANNQALSWFWQVHEAAALRQLHDALAYGQQWLTAMSFPLRLPTDLYEHLATTRIRVSHLDFQHVIERSQDPGQPDEEEEDEDFSMMQASDDDDDDDMHQQAQEDIVLTRGMPDSHFYEETMPALTEAANDGVHSSVRRRTFLHSRQNGFLLVPCAFVMQEEETPIPQRNEVAEEGEQQEETGPPTLQHIDNVQSTMQQQAQQANGSANGDAATTRNVTNHNDHTTIPASTIAAATNSLRAILAVMAYNLAALQHGTGILGDVDSAPEVPMTAVMIMDRPLPAPTDHPVIKATAVYRTAVWLLQQQQQQQEQQPAQSAQGPLANNNLHDNTMNRTATNWLAQVLPVFSTTTSLSSHSNNDNNCNPLTPLLFALALYNNTAHALAWHGLPQNGVYTTHATLQQQQYYEYAREITTCHARLEELVPLYVQQSANHADFCSLLQASLHRARLYQQRQQQRQQAYQRQQLQQRAYQEQQQR